MKISCTSFLTIVTIERPSPDRLSAYPYIYVSSTHWGSCPPESSCGIESIIVFRTSRVHELELNIMATLKICALVPPDGL